MPVARSMERSMRGAEVAACMPSTLSDANHFARVQRACIGTVVLKSRVQACLAGDKQLKPSKAPLNNPAPQIPGWGLLRWPSQELSTAYAQTPWSSEAATALWQALTMAASSALLLPLDTPTPSMAVPELHMMALTSAKSTFTRPGMVMMSEMPCTPCTASRMAEHSPAIAGSAGHSCTFTSRPGNGHHIAIFSDAGLLPCTDCLPVWCIAL